MVNTLVKYQSIPKYYVIFAHPFTDRQIFVSLSLPPPLSLSLSLSISSESYVLVLERC